MPTKSEVIRAQIKKLQEVDEELDELNTGDVAITRIRDAIESLKRAANRFEAEEHKS